MDDMLLSDRHAGELTELVGKLRFKFAMKDLGPARHIIGMKISRHHDNRKLFLSQRDCPTFGLEGEDMKSVPYVPTVGPLMYAMVVTRLDISHFVGVISRFMHNPDRSHWNAVKHVFR